MVIQLGVVCTGNVRVKEFLKKVDEVIYSRHSHFQFNTIYSCKVRVMLVQTTTKKKARQAIDTNNIDDVKEEGNSDGKTMTMKRWLTTFEAATSMGLRNIFGSSS